MDFHQTTVTDATDRRGYGPMGHGTWDITCSCGWVTSTNTGGKGAADLRAEDHVSHRRGQHRVDRTFGCVECGG